jgi:hypothetical protein
LGWFPTNGKLKNDELKGISYRSDCFERETIDSGKTIGETSNEHLRSQLSKVGIPEAHSAGRHILAARYNNQLNKIRSEAGDSAVAAYLESKKG